VNSYIYGKNYKKGGGGGGGSKNRLVDISRGKSVPLCCVPDSTFLKNCDTKRQNFLGSHSRVIDDYSFLGCYIVFLVHFFLCFEGL